MNRKYIIFIAMLHFNIAWAGYSDMEDPWQSFRPCAPAVRAAQPEVDHDERIIYLRRLPDADTTLENFEQSVSGFNWSGPSIKGYWVVLKNVELAPGKSINCLAWLLTSGFIVDLRSANINADAMEAVADMLTGSLKHVKRQLIVRSFGDYGSASAIDKIAITQERFKKSGILLPLASSL